MGGSGDLEQDDARDVVDFFSDELSSDQAKTKFKQQMIAMERYLRQMDVNWQPEELLERIPNPDKNMIPCTLAP